MPAARRAPRVSSTCGRPGLHIYGSPAGSVGPGWCWVVVDGPVRARGLAGAGGVAAGAGGVACFQVGTGCFPRPPIVPRSPSGVKALRPLQGGPCGPGLDPGRCPPGIGSDQGKGGRRLNGACRSRVSLRKSCERACRWPARRLAAIMTSVTVTVTVLSHAGSIRMAGDGPRCGGLPCSRSRAGTVPVPPRSAAFRRGGRIRRGRRRAR